MASFVVMEPPAGAGDRPPVYVRDGFHWLAFLFAPVWLLVHRLWIEALVVVVVMVALYALGAVAGLGFAASVMLLLVAIFIGLDAAELRVEALRRRAWREWGIIDAGSRADAEIRHVQATAAPDLAAPPAAATAQAFPAPARVSGPALGLFSYPGGR